jgi:hypothetical protein
MRNTLYALALAVVLATGGCAAGITGAAYDAFDDPSRKARGQADRAFIASFDQAQALRIELHLPLIDWCSECYRYDRKWALTNPNCVERIQRYERGDSTALYPPGHGVPGTQDTRQ